MQPEEWFDHLRATLPSREGMPTDEEIDALLEVARIAAHTSERWAAPVSTYFLGMALGKLDAGERAHRLVELAGRLESEEE